MRGVGVGATGGRVPAARLRRPSWRDPRLAVGVALVLGSLVLGVSVVAAADDTVPVFTAGTTLVPGTPLSEDELDVVRVRLEGSGELYLHAEDGLPDGAVAVRTVGAGEVVPRSAVGSAASLASRPVTVPVQGPLPADLGPGALVDVWIAETDPSPGGPPATPQKVLASVEVSAVDTDGGGLTAVTTASVAVLLDDEGTAQVLGALANGHRIDLVPVPGPVPGRR